MINKRSKIVWIEIILVLGIFLRIVLIGFGMKNCVLVNYDFKLDLFFEFKFF